MLRLLVLAVFFTVSKSEELSVPTSSGILKGKEDIVLDEPVNMFLGVPYARPPVNDLRFQPPVSFESEDVARDAQQFGPVCYQPAHVAHVISPLLKPNEAEVSEDCLFLNIYVPVRAIEEKLPVMVWLAGEGFNYADPVQYDGRYLAVQGKVIVVTVSYRISVFGFLSALNREAPGNVGLLDQRAALQWVKKNIASFGGDTERITLFGRFSGAMSAAIHAFSPFSKEEVLFHKVILMSGVPDGDWVFDRNPRNATLALAEGTNCVFASLAESIACMRRLPANVLLKAALSIHDAWRPIYDFDVVYEQTLKAASKPNYNPVDILIGFNKDEGSLCLTALEAMKSELFDKIREKTLTRKDFGELIAKSMMDVYKETDDFLNKLVAFQYSDSDESRLRDKYVEFCGDLYVTAHSQKLADIVASQNHSVYMYQLSHRPTFSIQPSFIEGAHGDDVLYALGLPFSLGSLPEEEDALTREIVNIVARFAYTGNPNAEHSSLWPTYDGNSQLLMNLDTFQGLNTVQKSTHDGAVQFWHDIVPAVKQRNCPSTPLASSLVDVLDHHDTASKTYIWGQWMNVSTIEYLTFGLLSVSSFLLFITFLAILAIIRVKQQHAEFSRLK